MDRPGQRCAEIEFFIVLSDGKIENYPEQLNNWLRSNDSQSIIDFLSKVEADSKIQEDLSKANKTLLLLFHLLAVCKRFVDNKIYGQLIKIFNGVYRIFKSLIFTYDNRLTLWAFRNIMSILNQLKAPERYNESSIELMSFLGTFCLFGFNKKVHVTVGSFNLILNYLRKSECLVPAIVALSDMFICYNESPIESVVYELIDKLKFIFISSIKEYGDALLAEVSLKTISIVSSWQMDDRAGAKRILQDKNNMILKVLLSNFEIHHAESIHCLYNLSKVPECRYELAKCIDDQNNCIKIIVKTLNEINENQRMFSIIIATLCYLCHENKHHYNIRHELGIHFMINVLKNEKHKKLHVKILRAFNFLVNDECNLLLIIKEGIIDIIAKELLSSVEELNKTNDLESFKFQQNSSIEDYDTTRSKKLMKWLTAENSITLSETFSSSLTLHPRFLEPKGDKVQFPIENYSPVCSDTELDSDCEEPFIPLSDLPEEASTYLPDSKKNQNYGSNREFKASLSLLKTLSFSNHFVNGLADPAIIQPLIKYIQYSTDEMASNILQRIAAKMSYFLPLIKQGFLFECQIFPEAKHYKDQLRLLAKEGTLVGELQNIIIQKSRGADIVAISVPILINNKEILRNLLLNHTGSGLKIIFDVLVNPEHKWYEAAILSIFKLAKTLNLKCDPTFEFKNESDEKCHEDSSKSSTLVTMNIEHPISSEVQDERLEVVLSALEDKNILHWPVQTLLNAILLAEKYSMEISSYRIKKAFIKKYHYSTIRANDYKSFYCVWKWSWEWSRNSDNARDWCKKLNLFSVQTFMMMKIGRTERIEAFKNILAGCCNQLVTFESSNPYIDFLKMIKESMKDYQYWFTKDDLKVNRWNKTTAQVKIEELFENIKIEKLI